MNIVNIILNIMVLLVEAFYFYLPINEILNNNNNKDKSLLYFKILTLNILSTIIFKSSIFRYICSFIIMYIFIFYFKKENKFLNFFIIPILFFIKSIIEFIVYKIFFNLVEYYSFIIILEISSLLFIIFFKNIFLKIYYKIKEFWNGRKEFYCRYFILLIFNFFIIFLIFNLLKIKEVL